MPIAQVQAKKEERELTISGSRAAPAEVKPNAAEGGEAQQAGRRRRIERRFGSFSRTFKVMLNTTPARCEVCSAYFASTLPSLDPLHQSVTGRNPVKLSIITCFSSPQPCLVSHERSLQRLLQVGNVACFAPLVRMRTTRLLTSKRDSVQLPDNADLSGITARFDNGVLMVTVKKTRPTPEDVTDIPIGM